MSRGTTVLASLVSSVMLVLTVATPAAAADNDVDYVALGDSYTAGVGAAGQSGLCFRSPNTYAGLWADNNDAASYRNLACIGATTLDVQLWQIPHLPSGTDLVTITVGGNDSGFVPAVATCTVGTDALCTGVVDAARRFIAGPLAGKLDTTFAQIKRKAPKAKVVAMAYPELFDTAKADCGPGGMSLVKRKALNAGANDLAELVKSRAKAAGIIFADVRDAFEGHGICASTPWLHGLTAIPVTNSFHPNPSGYSRGYLPVMAAAVK